MLRRLRRNFFGKKKHEFEVVCVIDYIGYPDFYQGHGHAFAPPDLVACIPFGVMVDYSETRDELLEMIMEDIDSRLDPYDFLKPEFEDEVRDIPEWEIREAIRDELRGIEEPLYEHLGIEPLELEEWEEYPMVIGYIHIYLVDGGFSTKCVKEPWRWR